MNLFVGRAGMQWRAPVHCAYIYNLRYSTNYKGFFWLFCLFFITNQTLWSQIKKKHKNKFFFLFLIWEQSVWLVMYSVVSGKLNHLGPWPILSQSILLTRFRIIFHYQRLRCARIRKQSNTTPIERPDWFTNQLNLQWSMRLRTKIFFRDRGLRNANKSLYPYKKIQFKINQERFHSALWHQNEEKDCIWSSHE